MNITLYVDYICIKKFKNHSEYQNVFSLLQYDTLL